ncbi:GntR family transcriptional regulator [Clostridium algidicarnis]|uniref:GntR family transcriptional regulator n=1 Tax=Clostridium algidicarnis TaxID=37659 RepID=UPI001C0E3FA3|nr:GntR family transcriptional regulator [Clostridium algidicarnis]MBU3227947.1 GntR family transcriptional regulator [Clostridium algidicarnis]MBU3251697.1 GntR family transcriptional regulator [Clostridium algidicarnis]
MIDKSSPIPAYYQLKEDVKKKISKGIWSVGQCIDSERELSKNYSVSRMTVRQALGELVQEGLLVRQKGIGTFVSEPKVKQKDMMSFSEIVSRTGMKLETKVLQFEEIEASNELKDIFNKDKIYKINRMRIVNGCSIANEIVYIPCDYLDIKDKGELNGSLYKVLEEEGYKIVNSETSIQALVMEDRYKNIFNTEELVPLLKTCSKNMTAEDKVIFIEEAIYRSDKYLLEVNISSKSEGKLK